MSKIRTPVIKCTFYAVFNDGEERLKELLTRSAYGLLEFESPVAHISHTEQVGTMEVELPEWEDEGYLSSSWDLEEQLEHWIKETTKGFNKDSR